MARALPALSPTRPPPFPAARRARAAPSARLDHVVDALLLVLAVLLELAQLRRQLLLVLDQEGDAVAELVVLHLEWEEGCPE